MLSSHNVAFLSFSPLVDQGAASAAINWLLSQEAWKNGTGILRHKGFAISRAGAQFLLAPRPPTLQRRRQVNRCDGTRRIDR
jgi:hypothetical protein